MLNIIKKIIPKSIKQSIKKDYHRLIAASHMGNDVQCPLCESEYKFFAASGNPRRLNAKCLTCESLERHRAIWLYLEENKLIEDHIKILHIAPEYPLFIKLGKIIDIDYLACDLFPEQYPYASPDKQDITKFSYNSESFDLIICNHVMEHIVDDSLAFQEMYRILAYNGKAIISVPNVIDRATTFEDSRIRSAKDRLINYGQSDHVRIYGMDIMDKIKEHGFAVESINIMRHFTSDKISRYALLPKETFFICTKLR